MLLSSLASISTAVFRGVGWHCPSGRRTAMDPDHQSRIGDFESARFPEYMDSRVPPYPTGASQNMEIRERGRRQLKG